MPAGGNWDRAMEERPDLDMYHSDREHPSIYGTYLATNVVYATVFGKTPIGLAYVPSEAPQWAKGTSYTAPGKKKFKPRKFSRLYLI